MGNKQHQQPNEPCRKHQIINKDYISVEQVSFRRRTSGVCIKGERGRVLFGLDLKLTHKIPNKFINFSKFLN